MSLYSRFSRSIRSLAFSLLFLFLLARFYVGKVLNILHILPAAPAAPQLTERLEEAKMSVATTAWDFRKKGTFFSLYRETFLSDIKRNVLQLVWRANVLILFRC